MIEPDPIKFIFRVKLRLDIWRKFFVGPIRKVKLHFCF